MKRHLAPARTMVALVLLAATGPARGVQIHESDNWSVGLDGVIKTYGMSLYLPWSPQLVALMGWDSNAALMGMAEARVKFAGSYRDRVSWNLQLQTAGLVSSQPGALTSVGAGVAAFAQPPRALPLQYQDLDDPSQIWGVQVDRAYVKVRVWKLDIQLGRQPVSLGVGRIWQPADLVATFSFLELDKEYKPGVDALRVDWSLTPTVQLTAVAVAGGPVCRRASRPTPTSPATEEKWKTWSGESCSPSRPVFSWDHSTAAVRLRAGLSKVDLGGLAGWVRGDLVVGAFATANLDRWNLRTEVTYTHDWSADDLDSAYWSPVPDFVRAVAGVGYTFATKRRLQLEFEAYYNGFGTQDPEGYLRRASLARVAEFGEIWNLGVFYLGSLVSWEAADTLQVMGMVVLNVLDPSAHLSLNLEWSLSDESALVLAGFLPLGRRPSFEPPLDFQVHSEFGLYPYMVFGEYKRYF